MLSMDEAQTQGKAEDISVMLATAKADLWSIGDPEQPIGASPLEPAPCRPCSAYLTLDHPHIEIKQQDLVFKSPATMLHNVAQYCLIRCGQCPEGIDDLLLQLAGLHPTAPIHARSAIGVGEGAAGI